MNDIACLPNFFMPKSVEHLKPDNLYVRQSKNYVPTSLLDIGCQLILRISQPQLDIHRLGTFPFILL